MSELLRLLTRLEPHGYSPCPAQYALDTVESQDPYYSARQSSKVQAIGATTAQESQESIRRIDEIVE
ncbi:hypothetical protein Taro_023778 [Colocasia esculenta]|uniref:Uncharacterized protein n=1 Tax=Colocasia esculenta TaxID=4460 RepID=A0A843VFH9_COLES|nr:hypothetical protein [Colocasia esculenta]